MTTHSLRPHTGLKIHDDTVVTPAKRLRDCCSIDIDGVCVCVINKLLVFMAFISVVFVWNEYFRFQVLLVLWEILVFFL